MMLMCSRGRITKVISSLPCSSRSFDHNSKHQIMKQSILLFFLLISFSLSAQSYCLDGITMSCDGFVDTGSIVDDFNNSSNTIDTYNCEADNFPSSGVDNIYIMNSIGESGAFNTLTITLTDIPENSDFDLFAINSSCENVCFENSISSIGYTGGNDDETITLEWEDEATIIIVVENYIDDGGNAYTLEFDYQFNFNYCSYFPNDGFLIDCSASNYIEGSIIVPICLNTFPTDCPPDMDYHAGEGPYFGYESVYTFKPSDFNGNISIDLFAGSGVKAFLYHRQNIGIDYTPIVLIGSGTTFINANYSQVSDFDQFYLVIDSPNSGTYPFSFTINYPGCAPLDPCGDCFTYTDIGDNKCKIDRSLTPSCGSEVWTYAPYPNGSETSFVYPSNGELQLPFFGDYLVCYTHYCDDDDVPTFTQSEQLGKTCCIVVSIGETCNEPPICHFSGSPNIQGSNIGHVNFFDASSSLNADHYSWHWGDGQTFSTSQTSVSHDYSLEPNPLTLCMVASNECGMSKYCISYDSYGDGISQFDCGLPFNPYTPPPIYPVLDGNTISFSGLSSFACSAEEVTFDPGDGSGEYAVNCFGAQYTYEDDGPYVCCIRVRYACYTICFCYTVRPSGFNCDTDPFPIECNDSGSLVWNDSTSPNQHSGISKLTNIVDSHNSCTSTYDGWDEENDLSPNVPFARHEVVYEITNPANNHFGDMVIDLKMNQSDLDLDVFIYSGCGGDGEFYECVASSTHENNSPNGKRDAILLTGVPAFDKYYVVVDGQSNAQNNNEGAFEISLTCGLICAKEKETIICGQTIESTTNGAQNNASYYCNCENESILGPAGNYGPEKIYRLDIQETSNVTIDLDVLNNNIDLELYLLNDCSASLCNRTSRNPAGQSEQIQKTLSAGIYYIVVEGFAGDAGEFSLSVTGCETTPVPSENCDLVSTFNFDNYSDGDLIPTDDNTGSWDYGINYSEDINDDMLDAVIEGGNNKRMVLNAGNYFFSDVALYYSNTKEGIISLKWEHSPQYVDGDLYGGKIHLYEKLPLLDFSEWLEIEYGYNSNGNYAILSHKVFTLGSSSTTKLADINTLINYNGSNPVPTFVFEYICDIDNDQFTLRVGTEIVYTGNFNFTDNNLLENRAINFSVDDEQDYMEIDNINVYECEDCSITYDDDCGSIFPTYIDHINDDNVSITLDQVGIPNETIEGYQVIDEGTGQVTNLSTLAYDSCIPGRSYKFCILYQDEEGCPKACCYRITIPLDCQFFLPYYTGDENNISYSYQADGLPSGYDVEQWYVDGVFSGTASTANVSYSSPQTSYVCCLIYDPFSNQHIICCRKICTEVATDCNNVTATYNNTLEVYELLVSGASEILSWNIDIPTNLPNNGLISDPSNFNPSDYGISPGQSIWVSVRYRDFNGCTKVCCKEITLPIPQDAIIFDIDEVCGSPGSMINIPVTLLNFENVGIVGFEILSADNNKVRIDGIVNKGAEFSSLEFNVINDKIILGWDDPQGGNISVPDGTVMFEVRVELLTNFDDPVILFGAELEVIGNNNLDAALYQGSACISDDAMISGSVKTEQNEPLEDVEIRLLNTGFIATNTNSDGNYTFNNITDDEVEIEAFDNDNIRQGVTNADVALIRRHYLQISELESDYKMIAGDVNRNGSITNSDVAIARRIYLQVIQDQIPNNTSWRFVPAANDISADPLDPNIQERIPLYNPAGVIENVDFIGIKVGDVNNSAGFTNNSKTISVRSAPLKMIIDEVKVTAGTQVIIPIRVEDFEGIALFGFEMFWDTDMMDLIDIQSVGLDGFTAQNFNIQDGKVILGWDEPNGGDLDREDGDLLNLIFDINHTAIGTTSLSFGSEEILDANFSDVETEFVSGEITVETTSIAELEGNQHIRIWPNPFVDEVFVDVKSSDDLQKIEVFDIKGKKISELGILQLGTVKLPNEMFAGSGVYILVLVGKEETEYRRILKID